MSFGAWNACYATFVCLACVGQTQCVGFVSGSYRDTHKHQRTPAGHQQRFCAHLWNQGIQGGAPPED